MRIKIFLKLEKIVELFYLQKLLESSQNQIKNLTLKFWKAYEHNRRTCSILKNRLTDENFNLKIYTKETLGNPFEDLFIINKESVQEISASLFCHLIIVGPFPRHPSFSLPRF